MSDRSAAPPRRRVAVTGLGAVSGYGWGVEALWRGLRSGETRLGPFDVFDHSRHRTHLAAQVPEPPPPSARDGGRESAADRFALFAAVEALAAAGLAAPLADLDAGLWFGSSTGGMLEAERFFARLLAEGRAAAIGALVSQEVNGPGDAVARRLGLTGPVQTISSACASGALAVGAAFQAVRAGEVEVALAGGSDSLCQLTYAGFNALRAVAEGPCRPFRGDREGMSLGEGAAVLVLEPLERALARGATPLAEVCGAGFSCDAHHMTAPEPQGAGAAAALAAALADAGLPPERIDFVNAHGTGTPHNDLAEYRALRRVFGERAARLPLAATKGLLGHLLGTAGAIEAVATVLCLARGEVHPVPGGGTADPEIGVDLVTGSPRPLAAEAAVSTSLAFGGSNAALVFASCEG
ncbi:MAG TPA: beta-ketoacyl-[acyl-carrier-protein] synthase family protein [Thermoanaerobaculia bacterium]|nr:beta-ketoacyl-[acyl-carrier-protein] synthase family protein [Thermoanaerobaculia bacterium]